MRNRHLALVALILLGLLAWLQYRLWFGIGGKQEVAALATQLEAQEEKNRLLKQRNDALAAEVDDLKGLTSGGAAIEERARDEFGLIKPGETFYRVVDDREKREP
ncbi:cell division protein FtsB [Lysobacteraceae bacterium NML120232]|nr:cell division protein FtsB [Xanthomonadaceae bacterium NML08-0793]PJK09483.1 cell division protein FtsB [Xanthomonadaceae bacterium NML120232]